MHPVEEYQDITLTVDGLNECEIVTLQEEEWVSKYYNSVHRKFDQLEIRCGRENQHPAEGALRPRLSSCSWREDAGMRTMSQRGGAPRRTGKKQSYGHKCGGQYVAVLFGLQLTSPTVKPLVTLSNKVRAIFY